MHMGQMIQSHGMHFFELAGPDLILGFDHDPATRNVVGLVQADPELTLKAVRLRKFWPVHHQCAGRTQCPPHLCRTRRREPCIQRRIARPPARTVG